MLINHILIRSSTRDRLGHLLTLIVVESTSRVGAGHGLRVAKIRIRLDTHVLRVQLLLVETRLDAREKCLVRLIALEHARRCLEHHLTRVHPIGAIITLFHIIGGSPSMGLTSDKRILTFRKWDVTLVLRGRELVNHGLAIGVADVMDVENLRSRLLILLGSTHFPIVKRL